MALLARVAPSSRSSWRTRRRLLQSSRCHCVPWSRLTRTRLLNQNRSEVRDANLTREFGQDLLLRFAPSAQFGECGYGHLDAQQRGLWLRDEAAKPAHRGPLNLACSASAYRQTSSRASARVRLPASRAANSAWKTHRPSIARLNLVRGDPCAVNGPPGGAGRQAQTQRKHAAAAVGCVPGLDVRRVLALRCGQGCADPRAGWRSGLHEWQFHWICDRLCLLFSLLVRQALELGAVY